MTDDGRAAPDEGESRTESEADDRPETQPMTDTDTTETGESTAAAGSAAEPTATADPIDDDPIDDDPIDDDPIDDPVGPTDGGIGRLSTDRLRGILDRVGLAALALLALIAGWGFYSQTGAAIRTWLDPAYQPIALAAFNLAILLVALAGVAHQLSRIRANE